VNYQATLREPLAFEGVGLHTGAPCRAEVHPAPPDCGFIVALEGGVRFPATAEYVVETARATVLGKDGATVSTVEHLFAALFGMGISNATIAVNNGYFEHTYTGPEIYDPPNTNVDIIFAEGIPAETFVDCDNRGMFHNAGEFAALYPDDRRPAWEFCAKRLEESSAELAAIRAAGGVLQRCGARAAQPLSRVRRELDIGAAEATCAGAGVEPRDVLDRLGHLVDQSLVVAEEQYGQVRSRRLGTMRQYAAEKLEETGESVTMRGRHREWFLAQA